MHLGLSQSVPYYRRPSEPFFCRASASRGPSASGLNYQRHKTLTFFCFSTSCQKAPLCSIAALALHSRRLEQQGRNNPHTEQNRRKCTELKRSVYNMRSRSHSPTSSFKSCSLKLFGQIVRDVNGLVSKQPFLSAFFFPWRSCVKLEQESILMVWRSTDIVYITMAAIVYGPLGGGMYAVFLKTSPDLSLPTQPIQSPYDYHLYEPAFWLPG